MASTSEQKFQFLREWEDRSILIKIKFELYEISTEVLLEVFSTCGDIETVEKFRSGEEFHSRILFQDKDSAIRALSWYNGRCIYVLWCKLELFQAFQFDRSNKIEVSTQEVEVSSEIPTFLVIGKRQSKIEEFPIESNYAQIIQDSPRSSDEKLLVFGDIFLGNSSAELIENGSPTITNDGGRGAEDDHREDPAEFAPPVIQNSTRIIPREFRIEEINDDRDPQTQTDKLNEDRDQEIYDVLEYPLVQTIPAMRESMKPSNSEKEASREGHHIQRNFFEVNPIPSKVMVSGNVDKELRKLLVLLVELMEIRLANSRNMGRTGCWLNSFECFPNANKVFVKMLILGVSDC